MVRIIDVCSGKGGVGKTTVAANLGIALQRFGKKTAVIDCNLTTSHLSLLFGIYSYPTTLNNFLRRESRFEEAVYRHISGLRVVPASLELRDIIDVDVNGLRSKLKEIFYDFDIVLLDSAPGLGKEALISLKAADEVLFVANTYIPSLVDVVKCKQLIDSMGGKHVLGIILNRVKGKKYEITEDEIRQFTELPIIGTVPEDDNVLESVNKKTLVTISKRNSPASTAFFEIGAKLAGTEYERPGLLDRLVHALKGKEI